MDEKGNRRVEIAGLKDKRQITAVFCGSIQGDFLPILTKEQHQCCHPCFKFPPGWHVTHSKNHWSTEETMLEYISSDDLHHSSKVNFLEAENAIILSD